MSLRSVSLIGLAVLLSATPAAAQAPGGDEQELVKKVNKAIDRGVLYLRENQRAGKNWEGFWLNQVAGMDGGVTALATLALLNCGVSADDKTVKPALDYLRGIPPQRTYVAGLTIMVFAEARQPRDLPKIQTHVDWLIANATRERGKIVGWSYPFDQNSRPDGSNTQYALLGLYAGKQAGAKIPDNVWREIRQLYLDTQGKDGADGGHWSYVSAIPTPSFTMTVAGVCGLLIADMGLDQSQQQLDVATGVARNCGRYEANDAVRRGMNWIGRNFAFERARGSDSTFYNVYGIERVGRLSGQRFLGKVDWYREGCEYLVRVQSPDGGWSQANGAAVDGVNVIATSFALLFLSKGRSPILISKLAWGDFEQKDRGVMVERGDDPGVVGWNRKHNDARHLTEFVSRELFGGMPLGWQAYDPRRREFTRTEDVLSEVGVLVQSPILYLNGHKAPKLSSAHKDLVKRYVEEGGFVLAEACCGSDEFARGFRQLMRELFPESELRKVPPEHAVWRSHFAIPPTEFPELECLDRGCKTVVIFSPQPLAGYWEEAKYMGASGQKAANRGEQAFRLGANVIAYATGKEPPKQRLTTRRVVDAGKLDRSPPKGFLKPAQLRLPGESEPAPAALRNLMAHLQSAARIDVVLQKELIAPADEELNKFKFMYMHGRRRFTLTDEEIENVKANLQTGGLLFADACCGKPEFDASFRELMAKMFPDQKLTVISEAEDKDLYTDGLYSKVLNGGEEIRTVRRREKADVGAEGGGFKELPPYLEGIRIDGRWVVIYSKYDVGCALENHKSTDCLGHDRDSALRIGAAAVLYALKR
jgi:hypothetical protein